MTNMTKENRDIVVKRVYFEVTVGDQKFNLSESEAMTLYNELLLALKLDD